MTNIDIANLEHASRSAFGWHPEGYDDKMHYGAVLAAVAPALGILAVAATLLIGIV